MSKRASTVKHDLAERLAKRVPHSIPSLNGDLCTYCDSKLVKYTRTNDHVVSLIDKKTIRQLSNVSNFTVPCCKSCNSKKGGKDTGSHLIQCYDVVYFHYDQDVIVSAFDDIDSVLKKSQHTLDNMTIFEDEHDYLFIKHIMSYDFIHTYDPDIIRLEELKRKFITNLNESTS